MGSRQAAVLLLLLLIDWSHAKGPGCQDRGDRVLSEEDNGPQPPQHIQTLGVPLTFPNSGDGEIWPEPNLPVSTPEVWQKRLGFLEQGTAESPA